MVGEMVDHAASMIGGAEIEDVKQAMKVVPADLRIELAQVEYLGLLDLCSKGQRFEGGLGVYRPERLYTRSVGIDGIGPGRPGYCTCQRRCQSRGESIVVHGCVGGWDVREENAVWVVSVRVRWLHGAVLSECCDESRSIRSRKRTVGRIGDGNFSFRGGS